MQRRIRAVFSRFFRASEIEHFSKVFCRIEELYRTSAGLAGETAEGPSPTGVYTSAIYESEAAMLRGESGSKHACVWKGREKKKGKVICKGNVQLKCGPKGWYRLGPC